MKHLSRRSLVTGAGAVAAMSAFGPRANAQSARATASGPFTFTDDRGRVIELPETPKRIFAEYFAALSLKPFGIKPVGIVGYFAGYDVPAEWDDVERFELASGELDIERLIALDPDISIGFTWDTATKNDFGAIDEDTLPGFTAIAPSLCILAVEAPVDQSIERWVELAAALGANTEAPELVASRNAFLAAGEAVRSAAAAKPGLTVMAMGPTPDSVYIGNPASASDLVYMTELGVNFVIPESPDSFASNLWQELSWEQLSEYPVDLYLVDNRPSSLALEDVLKIDVFAFQPAVQADQICPWPVEYITTYDGLTPTLTALADAINAAEIVTGA
jgi:iron complex transport system substrate-binding protein